MNGISHRRFLWLSLCLILIAGTVVAPSKADEPAKGPAVRVVGCDEKVQSRKRGVGVTSLEAADFKALAPGVSWYYNWHFETKDFPPKGVAMEFVPTAWGTGPEGLAGIERQLDAGWRPRLILAINEPNFKGQAFVTPEQAAASYAKIKAVADKYEVPVVGPQMSIGSAPADSIKAFDPVEKKELTYTFMVPYMKAFFHYADKAKTEVSGVGIHPYGPAPDLRGLVELAHKEFKRPIWVTEFNHSNSTLDLAAARVYLIQTTDYLERSPSVQGYAWFKERAKDHPNISLLADEPGKLTPLGEAYVAMPVHDADLYYRIPGRLQAENYVTLDKMEIWPTSDSDGFAHMTSTDAGGWLDYNLQVDKEGTYTIHFRVTGKPGQIDILKDDKVVASVRPKPDQDGWETLKASVPLPAGHQRLRIRCASATQSINWIEFTMP